jgi:hypothetical protein
MDIVTGTVTGMVTEKATTLGMVDMADMAGMADMVGMAEKRIHPKRVNNFICLQL